MSNNLSRKIKRGKGFLGREVDRLTQLNSALAARHDEMAQLLMATKKTMMEDVQEKIEALRPELEEFKNELLKTGDDAATPEDVNMIDDSVTSILTFLDINIPKYTEMASVKLMEFIDNTGKKLKDASEDMCTGCSFGECAIDCKDKTNLDSLAKSCGEILKETKSSGGK